MIASSDANRVLCFGKEHFSGYAIRCQLTNVKKGEIMHEKIRKFCDEKKITIAAFERVCGLSNGYVDKIEKLSLKPSLKHTKRMAQVMGISIEELIDETV